MERITFIEDLKGNRSLQYWKHSIKESKKLKVRIISNEEFKIVIKMTTERVIELIDNVLDNNTLNINEK